MAVLVDVAVSGARSSGSGYDHARARAGFADLRGEVIVTDGPKPVPAGEAAPRAPRDTNTDTGSKRSPSPSPSPSPNAIAATDAQTSASALATTSANTAIHAPSRPAAHTPAATRTRTDAHAEAHARTHAPAGTRACDWQVSGDDLLDLLATAAARTEARMTLQVEDETASPTMLTPEQQTSSAFSIVDDELATAGERLPCPAEHGEPADRFGFPRHRPGRWPGMWQ